MIHFVKLFLSLPIFLILINSCSKQDSITSIVNTTRESIIAFYSDRDGNSEIYTMDSLGQNQTRLTISPNFDVCPDISSDASLIVFLSNRDFPNDTFPNIRYEIYTMNLDGSNQVRLTNNNFAEQHTDWSPGGTKISFDADYDNDGKLEIYTINPNGSGLTRLTNSTFNDNWADWSPDGSQIVFCSDRDGDYEIFIMNSNGTNQQQITYNSAMEVFPAWSPSGDRIAFMSNRLGYFCLWTMNTNGTNEKQLTSATERGEDPVWSSDGSKIIFQSSRTGNFEIYCMDSSGANQTNLTNIGSDEFWPSFGLAPSNN